MKKEKLIQAKNELKQYFNIVEHVGCLFYCEQMFNHRAYLDILSGLRKKLKLPVNLIIQGPNNILNYYGDLYFAQNLSREFPRPLGHPQEESTLDSEQGKVWRWHSDYLEQKMTPKEIFNTAV